MAPTAARPGARCRPARAPAGAAPARRGACRAAPAPARPSRPDAPAPSLLTRPAATAAGVAAPAAGERLAIPDKHAPGRQPRILIAGGGIGGERGWVGACWEAVGGWWRPGGAAAGRAPRGRGAGAPARRRGAPPGAAATPRGAGLVRRARWERVAAGAAPPAAAGPFLLRRRATRFSLYPTLSPPPPPPPGLVLAVGLLKKGFDVVVLERDLTAIRGEGKYRGPIQVQSNALAALQALDAEVADAVLSLGVMTGDRINGLCDGLTGDW